MDQLVRKMALSGRNFRFSARFLSIFYIYRAEKEQPRPESRTAPRKPDSRGLQTIYCEQGTTTTPFEMVVLNSMSRFHLAAEAIRRLPRLSHRAPALIAECEAHIEESVAYAHEHLEDQPEIRDWVWTD